MTARAFEVADRIPATEFAGRGQDAPADPRYRLDVIGLTVDDVVRSAGGWLFDRAMAGWEVNLYMVEPSEAQALRILGIKSRPLAALRFAEAQAIAVAAGVFNSEECIRRDVMTTLDRGLAEVTLWGDTWPSDVHRRAAAVQHRLSGAARVFKAHALSAVALPADPGSGVEMFRSGARRDGRYEPDLLPVTPK
jgi:hypothetical protein